jgi:hypothetical protein
MKTSTKPPEKASGKAPAKNAKNGSFDWLSLGFICLLVGGTVGAKTLLLVDNDLEIKTKFSGKTWQLDSQSIRQYVNSLEKFTYQKLNPLGAELQQQSTHLFNRAGDALSEGKDLCVSKSQVSTILTKAKILTPSDESSTIDKAKTPVKPTTSKVSPSSPSSTATKNQPTPTADTIDRDWCISIGNKK